MLIPKCNNHGCELNIGCKCYDNRTREDNEYFKPQIYYDGVNAPKLICKHFIPHNIESIIRKSKMNFESLDNQRSMRKNINLKKTKEKMFEIVDEYGGDKKVELMRDLKDLVY